MGSVELLQEREEEDKKQKADLCVGDCSKG